MQELAISKQADAVLLMIQLTSARGATDAQRESINSFIAGLRSGAISFDSGAVSELSSMVCAVQSNDRDADLNFGFPLNLADICADRGF